MRGQHQWMIVLFTGLCLAIAGPLAVSADRWLAASQPLSSAEMTVVVGGVNCDTQIFTYLCSENPLCNSKMDPQSCNAVTFASCCTATDANQQDSLPIHPLDKKVSSEEFDDVGCGNHYISSTNKCLWANDKCNCVGTDSGGPCGQYIYYSMFPCTPVP